MQLYLVGNVTVNYSCHVWSAAIQGDFGVKITQSIATEMALFMAEHRPSVRSDSDLAPARKKV